MKPNRYLVGIACAIILPHLAQAQIYTFDTSTASEWSVTAGGAVNVQPYVYAQTTYPGIGNVITVTSTANSLGTFLPGGSLANFDGYWTAAYNFSLPANAVNVVLNYSDFFADDRAVLMLNGNIISATGIGNGVGYMVLTDGSAATPYNFAASGTVTTGFNVGGINTIEAIINNTGSGVAGTMINISESDGTGMSITGSVSYSAVPEPSTGAFIILAGLACAFTARRKSIA